MSIPAASQAQALLNLISVRPGQQPARHEPDFRPLTTGGRVGVEIHQLYTAEETGGPAAAIARYLPGAQASPHEHTGFELIYVLSGELRTDDGVYGPNSMLVMHPGSVHRPHTADGCTVLVVWERPVRPV
jgi:anti-sigma factor ChrR (cupin superfamily)